jgi:ketosteroid isomerase-like protein
MAKVTLCLLLLISTIGFAASPEEQLLQTDRDFQRATEMKRADGMVPYWADNAVVPQNPPLAGKQAILANYRKEFADPNFSLIWTPKKAEVFAGEKLGYTVGSYVVKFKDKSGQQMEQDGTYITVWKKQDDGSWQVIEDTGSEAGPPHPVK